MNNLSQTNNQQLPPLALKAILIVALAKLGLHLVSNAWLHYEYLGDEFYYIVCGWHPAWGYVDHPPLAPWLTVVSSTLFGDSLFSLRLLPALAGAATVVLAGLLTRELGGGRKAQLLASVATFVVPIFLTLQCFFSMNAFRPLFWTGGFILVARIVRTGERKWWYLLGLLLGIGLLNKISLLWFGMGLAAGMLATRERKFFLDRGPWICAAIAFAIFSPWIIWQINNGWPTIEFIQNEKARMPAVGLFELIYGQFLSLNPILFPLWVAGFYWLMFDRQGHRFRILGWIYLTVAGMLLLVGKSRPDYLAPASAALMAGGAVLLERLTDYRNWVRTAVATVLALSGLILAPLFMPLLPAPVYVQYWHLFGMQPIITSFHDSTPLPQFFAHMLGWDNMVEKIADVYQALPANEKANCVVAMPNFSQAGAVDVLGPKYGLPGAISTHNNYFLWGPGDRSGETMIYCNTDLDSIDKLYNEVKKAGSFDHPYLQPGMSQNIYLCRGLKFPISQVWSNHKDYD